MSVQTSYAINTEKYIHGGVTDLNELETDSLSAEGGAIGFGIAVSRGTDPDKQAVAGGDGTYFGVTMRDIGRQANVVPCDGSLGYDETEPMSIMRRGRMNLALAAGGDPGDLIKYADGTGVIDVGVAGAGETQIAGATLQTTTVAGAVGSVRFTGQN